jgi:hypothetical protein
VCNQEIEMTEQEFKSKFFEITGLVYVHNQPMFRMFTSGWNAACAWQREQDAKLLDAMAAQDKQSNYYQVADRAIRKQGK